MFNTALLFKSILSSYILFLFLWNIYGIFFKRIRLFFVEITRLFLVNLYTPNARSVSLIGLYLLIAILVQCVSGTMVSFSLISESMLIPLSRDEEDIEDLYTDDFFWMHERGVDIIFILLIFHFLKKLFVMAFSDRQESAWKSGSFLFLLIHGTIFFGLVLCCTHLSDITLTIAANIINTLTFKYGRLYWFLFTDQTLNTDTIIRSMYIHYILGFVCFFFGVLHALIMHYDYKDSSFFNGIEHELEWFDLIFKNEIYKFFFFLFSLFVFSKVYYKNIEPLSYEIFMWGDIGSSTEVRFLGVAPHWYFRSYMGWLLLCPHHYLGIYGLIFLMISIFFQPNLKRRINSSVYYFSNFLVQIEFSLIHIILFSLFITFVFYTNSFLPYGRFYNLVGGNFFLTFSYIYIFVYMCVPLYKFFCFLCGSPKKKKTF